MVFSLPHRSRTRMLLALAAIAAIALVGCGQVAKPQGWAAPITDSDGLVFTSSDAGKIGAYRLSGGGGRLWEFPGKDANLKLLGIYGTPVLQGDTLFVSGYNGTVVAINPADGGERWRRKAGERVIGAALVVGDTVYAGNDAGELVAMDRATGDERWRTKAANEIWATPVTDGTSIFLAGMDGIVTAYRPDGTQLWREKVASAAIAGAPLLKDGVLYLGSFDRRIYAVNASDGQTRWRSDEIAGNWFWTEPLVDGETVYAGSLDGRVYALDRATGGVRWRSDDLGSPVRGRAAIKDGVLVVPAKSGMLWGLRLESGAKAWEPVQVGGQLYSDMTFARSDLLLASESGKASHKLYRVNAAEGSVTEIPLNN